MAEKVVINCETGEAKRVQLTPQEEAERNKMAQAEQARILAQENRERGLQQARDAVRRRAQTDPDFAALVKLLGIEEPA